MRERFRLIDSARGAVLLLMIAYHFFVDLSLFGNGHVNLRAPLSVAIRIFILVGFLFLAGVSLTLAGRRRPNVRRLARLTAAAALVSAASFVLFPDSWVAFGVLHFLVFASLLAPPLTPFPWLAGVFALLALALPSFSPPGDAWALRALGLSDRLPHTLDFVPLFPWLGVVLLGVCAGRLAPRLRASTLQAGHSSLAWLGRKTLPIYLAHQALLLPIAWLWMKLAQR